MSSLNLLKNVVVISLAETSIWTGRAKLSADDFGLNADELPPEAIASLGSKRLISPDAIKPLHTVRYKMRRACKEVGTPFLGGFAVSVKESERLVRKLNTIVQEGEQVKRDFIAQFDTKLKQWHEANPEWAHILRAGTPEKDRITNRINFGFEAYLVTTPDNELVAANLLKSVDRIGNNLVEDIVSEAEIFVKRSLSGGREAGTQRTVEPLRRLQNKIESLSFIDPCLVSLSSLLSRMLSTVPTEGRVTGDAFMRLARMGYLLSDGDRFMSLAKEMHTGVKTVEQAYLDLIGSEVPKGAASPSLTALDDDVDEFTGLDSLFGGESNPAPLEEAVMEAVHAVTASPVVAGSSTIKADDLFQAPDF